MELVQEQTLVDDRGTTRPQADFRTGPVPDPHDPRVRAMLARLRSRMASTPKRVTERGGNVVGALAVAGTAMAAAFGVRWLGLAPKALMPIVTAMAVMAVVMTYSIIRRRAGQRTLGDISGELLSIGRCASCGYSIANASRRDGLVTCSECGAAWREERVSDHDVPDAPLARRVRFIQFLAISFMRLPSVNDVNGRPQVVFGIFDASFGRDDATSRGLRALQGRLLRRTLAWLLMLILVVALMLFATVRTGAPTWQVVTSLFVGIAILFSGAFRSVAGRRAATKDGMLRLRVCPACANPLAENADGHGACAACGALWPLPASGRPRS